MSADDARRQGIALQHFRNLRHVSRSALSERAGVPVATLARAERGIELLELHDLGLVLIALGFDLIDMQLLIVFSEQLARRGESAWGT